MEKNPPSIWRGQLLHFACLGILVLVVALVWVALERPQPLWFGIAIASPIMHQVFVWLTWRIELNTSAISKSIGFSGYLVFFFLLFFSRFVSLFLLSFLDRGSLGLHWVAVVSVTILLAIPGVYAMYSVVRYFGFTRAAGADHFDSAYREMPLVDRGIFRFTNNGMYVYAFFLFWAIAFAFNSSSALLVAAFSHIYIWVHYFATEKPDMDFLYKSDG